MTNKRFISIFITIFLLFVAVLGSAGCGGGGSSIPTDNEANNPIPSPEQDPTPEPTPTPQPEPVPEPEPTPAPEVHYTVTFDSQGGSSVPSQRVKSGETVTKPVDPTRDGHTFTGWYKSANGTTQFKFGSDGDKVTRDITLYAKWSEVPKPETYYTVTFDSNGGSSVPSQSIITGGTVTRPSDPVKEGYTFNGWFLASKQFKFGTGGDKVTGDITLVAGWMIINYTVTFDSRGGSSVPNQSVSYGGTISKPADPVRNGYTFVGWYKDSSLTQAFRFGSDGDKVTSNLTLYAKWSMSDSSDPDTRADIAVKKISIGYQDGDNSGHVTGNLTLSSNVEVSGDRFNIVWTSDKPTVISTNGIVKRSSSDVAVSLTATVTVGSVNRFTTFNVIVIRVSAPDTSGFIVSFDSNGGSTVASINVPSGRTVTMPEPPTKEGYVFAGWYKDENFTKMFMFGADGDKVTQNITLYAQWIKLDTLRAEYAIGEIVIGYAEGDNLKYVTRNLTLPSKAGEVNIAWSSSNPDIISSTGTVTRPSDSDVNVTLTATATSGTELETREFSLKVIRARLRVSADVEVLPVQDAGSGDLSITYKASSDQIVDIEGNYSKIAIQNADDALDAIQGIHEALGINNPYEELETFLATSDSYGSEYSFQQVYKGVKVFGRSVMASTNTSGKGNFLHSSFLSSDVLDRANMKVNLTASQAEAKAKAKYSGTVSADTARTELVVYSLWDYEASPVYSYIVKVYSTSGDDYIDEKVFVNADTGGIIMQYPSSAVNIHKASGKNEFGADVSFDVIYSFSLGTVNLLPTYLMQDPNLHIKVYNGFRIPILRQSWLVLSGSLVESLNNTWTDKQAVTVYTNMREILAWWKQTFGRDSLDDNGGDVNIVIHNGIFPEDNAYWNHDAQSMLICDKPTVSSFDHFFGAALDVMMHESEHGVLKYTVGELPYQNATGTIDEGYADIFACIKDKNWQLGEELFNPTNHFRCMRDIAVLSSDNILNKRKLYALDVIYAVYKNYKPSSNNDYNSVHYNSHIVSHPAYLMHQDSNPVNGLTWDELGKVWYKSMYMGLSASSKFEDVRRCVLWSAQEINLPANKIATIKSAFDKVGITASTQKATLKGTVTDYDTSNNLSSVDVAVFDGRISGDAVIGKLFVRKSTPSTGRYSFELEAGTYPVIMQKDGYVMFTGLTTITKSEDTTLDVKLVRLGNGSLSGTVRSTPENSLLQGVTVNVRSGWNVQTGSVVQTTITDADGYYSFASINNGYYTVELVKSGFETAMLNVIVSGNTEEQDGYLSIGIVGDIPINEEHFPDQAFRSFISRYIDTNHDNVLSIEEIENTTRINHPLYPSYSGTRFSSLQGIEYFTHLTYLNCNYHTLTDLDLSKNIALRELYCYSNRLANLNVRGCASLQILWCRDNLLTTLDVTGCNSLQELSCHDNQLITLKVNNCISLQFLECSHNQIISLDVNDCTALQNLNCYDNQLTVLDLTQNTLLQGLSCTDNKLTTLNLSNCTVLHNLLCYDNQLVTLDVSNCTALERLECGNNQLTTLDVSHCVALQTLQCGNNQLASLNVNNCSALKYLICPNNQISVLDLSTCVALQGLSCKNNLFTELDLTHCPSLNTVNCDSGVEVKYAPSSNKANLTSHTSALNMRAESDTLILAVIPAFIADHTGTYCFTALIDREPPESSSLLLLSNSEDIHGTFTETESPLCVKVSADLLAGRTYAPVIVAISEDESQNSGCNAGITGIIMIAGIIIIALPKSFIQRLIVLKNN